MPLPYKSGAVLMPYNGKMHLFCIMNDPCKNRLCLVCMVTTIYKDRPYDNACILQIGDHGFIRHPSYVLYRTACQINENHFRKMLEMNEFSEKENFRPDIFRKIADGLYSSENTTGTMLRYADDLAI